MPKAMRKASRNLLQAISTTWGQIEPDCDFVEDNEGALEMVIDADRLITFTGNTAAEAELHRLTMEYGYEQTLRALSQQITLY